VAFLVSSPLARDRPVGYISVECGGAPMLVAVDGQTAGDCPVDSIPLAPGPHLVQAWPSAGRAFSATPLTRRVEVVANNLTLVDLSSTRLVRIESEPFGAMITRGGTPVGTTPLTLSVSPDDQGLLVEMDGFQPVTLSARSLLDGPSPLRLVLEPIPGAHLTSPHTLSQPSAAGNRGVSPYLTGAACVGAITAAVLLKEEADSEFKDYLVTGNLDEMNRHFKRAQKLDSWAVASMVVGEVTLGLLIYDLWRHRGEEATTHEVAR
jgi:hypothetical protein